ncbi:MAG: DUF4040 domain-containing protein [Acidimicrobiaceae bacterium]|nr:DUF4040 domain-containing protein [Acidimicrobiaceae bacterium]MXZ64819.1 DUF4040 domain-containing protein [Acidimicrobiaceae bacterium]MYE55498.1 DUF4040 domain-containing protein [Acidimicrobiaceae bacterium]MYF32274.1 DUF4040 domain-containing protein [Acidimicrobiaceae bacterium]MYG76883.1 DUF4040 domain-containing protein [Acidimicrobiaceae bacterium]
MILGLLVLHVAVCVLLAATSRRLGRNGLLVGAVPPAVTAVWAATRLGDHQPESADVAWVPGLDLAMTFRVDAFVDIMTLIVSGIGFGVFVYAYGYFAPSAAGIGRFAATLLAFSTAMLGLVWADSVWSLFVFWELTSVTSFLLIGHKNTDKPAQVAARQALMITAGGGLVLLAGLLLVTRSAGTTLISEMMPVDGATATFGAVLVMVGAATKSAQVPFHPWLPSAMVAPTPVSAYLHSATMVKAGVVLVAVMGPALGGLPTWKACGLAFGVASVFWGAIGALRHRDAKLVLAWGTVSQLGMLITLFSVGTAKAALAAVTLLVAHALFKGALFLVVGEIDVRARTRNIDELGGLARSMPIACTVAVLAGLSMAGAPPLLGFVAKEAAIKAALALEGPEAWIVGFGVIAGSVLTVAYTARFLVTVFGPGPETALAARRHALSLPAAVLGLAGLVGYAALGPLNGVLGPAAARLAGAAEVSDLHRWPGLTLDLGISAIVLALGASLGLVLSRRLGRVPVEYGARWTDASIEATMTFGRATSARLQHGSLPVYLVTMAGTAALAALPFLGYVSFDHVVAWDTPLQAVLAVAIIGAAVALSFVGTRLAAGLALGAAGIAVAAVFVVHGAADLALTQLLVEAAIVVGFVLAFGHLSRSFPRVGLRWRAVRMTVAGLGGAAVVVGLAAASRSPVAAPPLTEMATASVDEGGGSNIVNVILTDIRALDTLGEVLVLATVALGVLALARASDRPEGSAS